MELAYGKYASLASGGAIGLALFFFCSGFTLNIIGGGFLELLQKANTANIPNCFCYSTCRIDIVWEKV